jgi:hypothetical protein
MRVIRTNFDRHEVRRDRRYPLPPLVIAIDGVEYSTVNWSLGGFLISGFNKDAEHGKKLTGTLCLLDRPESIDFAGTVVRIDEPEPGLLAVQFTDLGDRGMSILDRIIARRLFRG